MKKIEANLSLPHIQLFLFNSSLQKLFSSQLPITSSLRSFRSISVPPQGTHYREAHRLLEDYAAYTIQRCMHEPRFTNNSTDPSKFWEGAPFHAQPKPDRFARGSRFFLAENSSFLYLSLVHASSLCCRSLHKAYFFAN